MNETVGLIRSLHYYQIGSYWETFFTRLGVRPVYADCGRQKMARTAPEFENEFCLPLKYFLVQARELLRKSPDYLFVPAVKSVREKVSTCPKIVTSGELVRLYHPGLVFPGSTRLIAPRIQVRYSGRNRGEELVRVARVVGKRLSRAPEEVEAAVQEAARSLEESEEKLYGTYPAETETLQNCILILGHRYSTLNPVLNNNLVDELKKQGASPVFKEDLLSGEEDLLVEEETGLPEKIYFSEGAELFRAAHRAAFNERISGIIYVSMFNCGFDAVIEDIISRRVLKESEKPYLNLVLDEHSTTANLKTKLEVFMEMVENRLAVRP